MCHKIKQTKEIQMKNNCEIIQFPESEINLTRMSSVIAESFEKDRGIDPLSLSCLSDSEIIKTVVDFSEKGIKALPVTKEEKHVYNCLGCFGRAQEILLLS